MSSLDKARAMGCFKQVADVIGEDQAAIELARVIDYKNASINLRESEKSISAAFCTEATPQGYMFWFCIKIGEDPNELVSERGEGHEH